MTQPPTPGAMAAVDQAHAEASKFIDQMLTDGVTELQSGLPMHKLFVRFGGGLYSHREVLSETHMRVVLAVAVARLARLHHAVEQLADQLGAHEPSAIEPVDLAVQDHEIAAELRKLVDDHG